MAAIDVSGSNGPMQKSGSPGSRAALSYTAHYPEQSSRVTSVFIGDDEYPWRDTRSEEQRLLIVER